jgi:hypothetical protein
MRIFYARCCLSISLQTHKHDNIGLTAPERSRASPGIKHGTELVKHRLLNQFAFIHTGSELFNVDTFRDILAQFCDLADVDIGLQQRMGNFLEARL